MGKKTKSHPIVFNTEDITKVKTGLKTQLRVPILVPTRIKNEYPGAYPYSQYLNSIIIMYKHSDTDRPMVQRECIRCPYGEIGDQLWVQETWARFNVYHWPDLPHRVSTVPREYSEECDVAFYKEGFNRSPLRWYSATQMPRWASRFTLEITDVRVQNIQDISEEDAQAEGCNGDCPVSSIPAYERGPHSYHFAQYWEAKYGDKYPKDALKPKPAPYCWDENPFVWAITFKVLEDRSASSK